MLSELRTLHKVFACNGRSGAVLQLRVCTETMERGAEHIIEAVVAEVASIAV